jgi:hypothetical protein
MAQLSLPRFPFRLSMHNVRRRSQSTANGRRIKRACQRPQAPRTQMNRERDDAEEQSRLDLGRGRGRCERADAGYRAHSGCGQRRFRTGRTVGSDRHRHPTRRGASAQGQHRDNWISDPITDHKYGGFNDFAGNPSKLIGQLCRLQGG